MRVTLLGTATSQGIPVITCNCRVCRSNNPRDRRLRASAFIETNGKKLVIDAGPDFRQQMLREDVRQLDAIIFSHQHKDHTAGLDDVRPFNYTQQKPADIYAEKQVIDSLKYEYAYVFNSNYPGIPVFNIHEISHTPFEIDNIAITPIRVYHHKLPIFGFRIADFTYITDANYIEYEELEKIKGTKVLIINALRKESHISHYNLEEALNIIKYINPEMAWLTHISHAMGLHDTVNSELPSNVKLGYDGLSINI